MGFGIIAGAMGGLGQGMVNEADSMKKEAELQKKIDADVDLTKLRSELEKQKELSLIDYRDKTQAGAEQRDITNQAIIRGQVLKETIDNAPALAKVEADRQTAIKKAALDPELQDLEIAAKKRALTSEEQTKLDFFTDNKKAILDQKKALTDAGVSSAEWARINKGDEASKRAETSAQRTAVVEGMKNIERDLERSMTLAKDSLDPAAQKMYADRVKSLSASLDAHRNALKNFAGDAFKTESKPTADGLDADLAARIADIAAKNKKAGTPSAAPSSSKEESTPYEPPIGSPAAKAKERRDDAAKNASNQSAVLLAVINDAAQEAILSGDPAEALKVQGMPGFASLDRSTKTLIFNLVNGKK